VALIVSDTYLQPVREMPEESERSRPEMASASF
jgi:hypothetical protein